MKQHQEDRERSRGYQVKTLCGLAMPEDNRWGNESCERCARVARQRADARAKAGQ